MRKTTYVLRNFKQNKILLYIVLNRISFLLKKSFRPIKDCFKKIFKCTLSERVCMIRLYPYIYSVN